MSTKSSVGYKDFVHKTTLHIYLELLDGKYYLEDDNSKIELPKEVAIKFAEVLNGLS